jgi:Protein of unknown function (DUF2726)
MHRFGGGLGGPLRVGGNSTTLTLLWVERPCLDRAEEFRSSLALGCDTPAGGVFNGPIRDATMTRSRCRARAACLLPTIKVRQGERRDEGSGRMVRGAQYTYLKRLGRVRSLLLLLLALLIARYVEAQAIERWMTPSGSIYFGHNPPPGSTLLGVVGDVEPSTRSDAPRDLPHQDHDSASMATGTYILPIVIGLFVVACGVATTFVSNMRRSQTSLVDSPWPYLFKQPFSHRQEVLYFRLRNALPDHIVLAQVRLTRFLNVKNGYWFYPWKVWINRLSADFLVYAKDSSVRVAIDLDDDDDNSELRNVIAATKDKALTSANVRLVRWSTKALPDEDAIRRELLRR